MTDTGISSLDRERIRELFDLRNNLNLNAGGFYTDDPYPVWHELRAKAAVHEGTVHEIDRLPGRSHVSRVAVPRAAALLDLQL